MSTNINKSVSTQGEKIITLGGLETFYTELKDHHFNGINNEIDKINDTIENNNVTVTDRLDDIVIVKGDTDNSAVLKGGNNTVTGKYSAAIGYNTIAKNIGEHASGIYNVSNGDTQFSIGIGTSEDDRKNAFEVKQNGDIYIKGIGGYVGTNPTDSEDVASAIKDLVAISYAELVNLKSNSKLVPGRFYRITDYVTTTIQANTQSAGHPFDVIVLALSESEISEQAWAIHSARDTDGYFANSKLSAWKIWYSLDNDTDRFVWADTANGKGVIYRMIDEWNNDCPYDFKNIQFKHPNDPVVYPAFYYTFSTVISGVVGDHSHNGDYCYGNAIGVDVSEQKQYLNGIVFINTSKASNCYANSFGNECYSNSFGNECYSNSFGNYCRFNSFGYNCYSNSFGYNCRYNSFSNYCYTNSFGNVCYNNSFGNYCHSNSFGNECYSNSFGNKYNFNSFGNNCYSNSFGNYCRYNKADDGVSVILNNSETASSNQQIQNYHLTLGLTSKTIEVERNRAYQTTVAIDSSGNVKQFCIADIIQ